MRDLGEKLKDSNITYSQFHSPDTGIKAAKLLKPLETHFEADIVYIGLMSLLSSDLEIISNANLICIEDPALPKSMKDNPLLNLIMVDKITGLEDLFNEVQDILLNHFYFMQSSTALLNSIIRGKGLQYIIDIGSELLGNPVMLGDSNHRLLAYSRCDDVTDGAWTELRDTGYCSYEYTEKYDFKQPIEDAVNSPVPVIRDLGKESKVRRIFAKVVVDNMIMGHLAVLEHHKTFNEKDLEMTSFICDVIASEMLKNTHYNDSKKIMMEMLMVELLEGSIKDEKTALARMKYLKWIPKDKLYVLAVKCNRYEDSFGLIAYIRDTLPNLLEGKVATFYDNHIIFIMGCGEDQYLKREDFFNLILFLQKNELYAGMSQGFSNVMRLKKYYEQALTGIELGTKIGKQETFYVYEDYAIYDMIAICSKKKDMTDFCHPALLKLMAHDAKHKTDYVDSLYAYVFKAGNMVAAADALYIHRNTMSYRIGKIQEIIGLELDNDDLTMNLFVSYKLLEYGGKI